ncbi:MAG: hypothetical protein AB1749_01005 [Pseudomonadota bacterium]
MTREQHINPVQWHQAVGYARQSCARFFRDGNTPEEAMRSFGLATDTAGGADWEKAVEAIAETLCAQPQRKAA